ncbi:histone deacetylase 15-like isoform X3 [Salvia miltiorrhiza]|uniref:histone deacetylase 15-like isoform X3 n=1 Tax=Salvia miltiorrhiza TaxID=226208 RepID=UPI0025ABB10B|nr:histone deacetylase 15-like isoform X3 [Salvia miltiorrhiza]
MSRFKEEEIGTRLRNGDSAPLAEAASSNSFKPHLAEQKNGKRKSDMSLEEMYNSQYDFGDDEDDDSDWEPSALPAHSVVEIPKWFCLNCTMLNIGDDSHCDVCGEHRESGILKRGFVSSASSREVVTQNGAHAADGLQDPLMQSIASDNPTAIGFDERMLLHEEVVMKSHPHPERPDRLRAIAASLATTGIFPGRCHPISAREITQEELLKVHSLENIEAVEITSRVFSSYFTPDTYANQYSATAARLAAGLCFDLAAAIWSGRAKNGFALVRPPGHHAGVKHAMGFCLHNNAALAASAAQIAGAKKVLIIDWDVHHGNGTQEIFEKNKSVLYISLHRHEGGKFYPGTGSAYETGSMGAEGHCVNIPWSRGGVGDNDYIFAFQHVVLPIATEFDPDFTIISAGFDAARGDPLGGCDVTPAGYAQMTQMCRALSGGKVLVILEGGYNLRSISSSATAVIEVLLGESPKQNVGQVMPSKAGVRAVLEVLKIHLNYWSSLESKFTKLQSEWGWYTLEDKSAGKLKKKKRRGNQVPVWWKWGRRRWMYMLWCKKKIL